MAEYVPVIEGLAVSRMAAADITAGQALAISSGGVSPAPASAATFVGFAGFDAKVGDIVTYYRGGVQRGVASGSIAAGALVACADGGAVAPTANASVAIGISANAAAAGQTVELEMIR